MTSGPSKAAEAIAAFFVPPACREEVVGDLHERYRSPTQYCLEALCTVPLVIASRIRHTADPRVLLIQAFALYVSFLGAARVAGGALLGEQWGLLRLAIPAAFALFGMILEDAYAHPGRRTALSLVRGPVVGLGLALLSQAVLWSAGPDLAVPLRVLLYGCAMSLLLSSTVRMLFPPIAHQLQGIGGPALWLKQAGGPVPRFVKGAALVAIAVIVGMGIVESSAPSKPRAAALLLVALVAYQLWKRA
jgi:hypothetical protein